MASNEYAFRPISLVADAFRAAATFIALAGLLAVLAVGGAFRALLR